MNVCVLLRLVLAVAILHRSTPYRTCAANVSARHLQYLPTDILTVVARISLDIHVTLPWKTSVVVSKFNYANNNIVYINRTSTQFYLDIDVFAILFKLKTFMKHLYHMYHARGGNDDWQLINDLMSWSNTNEVTIRPTPYTRHTWLYVYCQSHTL